MRAEWLKHGVWNTADHATTRIADALTTLVLIWAMPTESFSKLALAQAYIAPLLIAFVCPEAVIYRDYSRWKAEGQGSLTCRLRAFRLFGQLKGGIALAIAVVIALLSRGTSPAAERFWALLWAFSLSLAPQLPGADREFLRMELKLQELFWLTFYQKVTLLGGTLAVILLAGGGVRSIACVALFSAVSSAALSYWRVRRALPSGEPVTSQSQLRAATVISDSLASFSLWSHLSGSIQNTVQTLDLFFLGVFRLPAREVGLYAASLKLANFATALPGAGANLFSVWIARREDRPQGEADRSGLFKFTGWLFLGNLAQGALLLAITPSVFGVLSHGRWDPAEIERMRTWLAWILAGMVIFCSTYLFYFWVNRHGSVIRMFFVVLLPWFGLSAAIYAWAAHTGDVLAVARANLAVAVAYALMLLGGVRILSTRRQT